jgi:hypothetical protein
MPRRRSGGGMVPQPRKPQVTPLQSPVPKQPQSSDVTLRTKPTAEHDARERRFDRASGTFIIALLTVLIAGFLINGGSSDLARAWRIWTDGRSASTEPLWGKTVLWWARAGKIMQFAAGLVVILDLIGPERLRRIGIRTGEQAAAVRAQLVRMRARPEQTRNGAVHTSAGLFLVGINLLLLILLATSWSTITQSPAAIGPYVVAPIVLLVFLAVGTPERTAGARLPLLGLSWVVSWIVLGVPAVILDKANPGHVLRWLALFVFIAGFGFDLLGS